MATPFSRPHRVPRFAASARLFDYLRERLVCVPVNELSGLLSAGAITVDGAPGAVPLLLHGGESIVLDAATAQRLREEHRWVAPFDRPITVVYEDADLLVADKPAGMHVHPLGRYRDETLTNALVFRAGARATNPWGEWRPHPAHRLDRPAQGLVAIAKSSAIRDSFRRLLDDAKVHRAYEARVRGRVAEDEGTIDAPLGRDPTDDYRRAVLPVARGGQPAVTHWRVLARDGGTRLALTLETGRTHQIRAHLASIGHPIEGDTLYEGGPKSPNAPAIPLFAVRLSFPHPRTGAPLAFSLPPRRHGEA